MISFYIIKIAVAVLTSALLVIGCRFFYRGETTLNKACLITSICLILLGIAFGNPDNIIIQNGTMTEVCHEEMDVPDVLSYMEKAYVPINYSKRVEADIELTSGASYYAKERYVCHGMYVDRDVLYVGYDAKSDMAQEQIVAFLK